MLMLSDAYILHPLLIDVVVQIYCSLLWMLLPLHRCAILYSLCWRRRRGCIASYTVVNTSSFCVSVFSCTHKCLFFSTSSARKRYVFAFSAQRISLAKFCSAQSAKMDENGHMIHDVSHEMATPIGYQDVGSPTISHLASQAYGCLKMRH